MTKSIFVSKAAAMGAITSLTGVVAKFYPEVALFVASNSSDILIGVGIIAIVIRKITKGKVTLFPSN
jgi:hypothetical protein